MKFIKNLVYCLINYQYLKRQLEVFSLFSILTNNRKLRKDYIIYTANKYRDNINKSGHHYSNTQNFEKLFLRDKNMPSYVKEYYIKGLK